MKLISSLLIIALVWLNLSDPNLVSSLSLDGSNYSNDIPGLVDRINSGSENNASEKVGDLNNKIGKVKKEYYSLNTLNYGKVDQSESRIFRAIKIL